MPGRSAKILSLTRAEVMKGATIHPHTKDFRHLRPFPRRWTERHSKHDPHIKFVPPFQRIKYWNIVPGDKIGLRGDRENTIHEVLSINKLSNRVILKGANAGDSSSDRPAEGKSVAYARCRLFLGKHEYPITDKMHPTGFVTKAIFARRVGTTKPYWDDGRWQWGRIAIKTDPILPEDAQRRSRLPIPWPQYTEPAAPPATRYDTPGDVVEESTYSPPPIRASMNEGAEPLQPAPEQEYVRRLWNDLPHDNTLLAELYFQEELASEHSRSRKQARWKAKQVADRAMLDDIMKSERKYGRYKSKTAANAAAIVKWKASLAEEKRREKIRRAIQRGDVAKEERKAARKEKKQVKKMERLRNTVLEEAKNQVLPTSL